MVPKMEIEWKINIMYIKIALYYDIYEYNINMQAYLFSSYL